MLQKDVEVEKSQTNFMVLVQNLQKNPAERKLFFRVPKSSVIPTLVIVNNSLTFKVFFIT